MAAKHTHTAVHAVVMRNEKNERVEVAPGTPFTPKKEDVESLEARGAIRKARPEDFKNQGDTNVDAEAGVANVAPDGYARGTLPASAGGALTGDENDALDPEQRDASGSSADVDAKAPASRTTTGKR